MSSVAHISGATAPKHDAASHARPARKSVAAGNAPASGRDAIVPLVSAVPLFDPAQAAALLAKDRGIEAKDVRLAQNREAAGVRTAERSLDASLAPVRAHERREVAGLTKSSVPATRRYAKIIAAGNAEPYVEILGEIETSAIAAVRAREQDTVATLGVEFAKVKAEAGYLTVQSTLPSRSTPAQADARVRAAAIAANHDLLLAQYDQNVAPHQTPAFQPETIEKHLGSIEAQAQNVSFKADPKGFSQSVMAPYAEQKSGGRIYTAGTTLNELAGGPVTSQIEKIGGLRPSVLVVPVIYDCGGAVRQTALFQVKNKDGSGSRFVDYRGFSYSDLHDYQQNSDLPSGTMSVMSTSADMRILAGASGKVSTFVGPTHVAKGGLAGFLQSTGISTVAGWVTIGAGVVTDVAGGVVEVGSGGLLTPLAAGMEAGGTALFETGLAYNLERL